MNQGIAEITLIYALPLGISFVTIFAASTTHGRNAKVVGAILSTLTVVIDCLFYFVKNTIIVQNVEGGILLSFFLLFLFSIFCMVQSEEWSTRASFLFFSMCMLVGCIGIACFERPSLVLTSSYSPTDFVTYNKKYEDYISSFDNVNSVAQAQETNNAATQNSSVHANANIDEEIEHAPEVMDRLDTYADKAENVIDKMFDIMRSIDSFEPLEPNAGEMEREKRSQQALAINNKATTLNRKAIGIFHPMEAREAHSELVQASETIRSASHTLYSYCLAEDQGDAMKKYAQARDLIAIAKRHIDKFNKIIQNLTNNQPQQ
jgi:hypothetical protein